MNRLPSWVRQHIAALRGLLVLTVICGIAYPLLMFGVAQVAFHNQANGSPVSYNGRTVGSSLLCQEFTDAKGNPLPQYFQPRPSAAVNPDVKTDYGCNPLFSAASNLGPNNAVLVQQIKQRQEQIAKLAEKMPGGLPGAGGGLPPNFPGLPGGLPDGGLPGGLPGLGPKLPGGLPPGFPGFGKKK